MALDRKIKQLINYMVQEIIVLFEIEIPISDIYIVVSKIGGKVIEDSSLDIFSDGKIRKTGMNSFVISVSPYQTNERRNFTIAHELGHLFLHMGFMTDDDCWKKQNNTSYYRNGDSDQEYQANEFAAALLMPEKEYKRVMDENTIGNSVNTYEVAKYFNVSIDAAANRGKWLGYLRW